MTWLWPISFSLVFAGQLLANSLSGRVELADSRDPGVRKHRDYSGVAVWLELAVGSIPGQQPGTARMVQRGKRFIPHVLAIPTGTTVEFPNFDPIFHNAFSNFSGQRFDTGLYPPGTSESVVFRREGIVRVFCNIHSTMSAVIVVVNTPFIAVTGRDGVFRLDGVSPGDYRMKVWHERATAEELRALERRIAVSNGSVVVPPIRISESGYIEVPHRNKYGQEYSVEHSEHQVYPGVQK